jgi:hypothetical protein
MTFIDQMTFSAPSEGLDITGYFGYVIETASDTSRTLPRSSRDAAVLAPDKNPDGVIYGHAQLFNKFISDGSAK